MLSSTQQLRDRLIAGDETALAELYDAYAPLVYGRALRVTGDWAAAQDVTQEVFVHVWEHPSRFDSDRGGFHAWVSVIAHRRAVDWVRREAAQRRSPRPPDEPPEPAPGPAEIVVSSLLRALIRRAVDALPPAQRRAVRLAYFEGHTYRQVAAALGIPEGTAKSRLRLGLAAVGRRLQAEGLAEGLSEGLV